MAGFTFGAAPAPAPSTSSSAPPPSSSSSSSGLSFSFGGSAASTNASANANINTSVAPNNVNVNANAPTPAASAPAGGGGFSFASSSSVPSTSTTSNVNVTAATANATNATTTTASTNSAAKVPTYEKSFPFLAMNYQIESTLNSIHDHLHSNQDDNYTSGDTNSDIDVSILGQELYHLLSPYSSSDDNKIPTFGHLLSNPNHALLQSQTQSTPNRTLRQQLLSNPILQFPSNNGTNHNHLNVTQNMLQQIFRLSDLLQISEMDAASLYSVIRTTTTTSSVSSSTSTTIGSTATTTMEPHIIGKDTIQWFQQKHIRPNNLMNGSFMDKVIQKAKIDGTYYIDDKFTATSTTATSSCNEEEKMLHLAMDLYFTERNSYLQTLLLLIQHRVLVYTNILQQEKTTQHSHPLSLSSSIILESTDLLLNQNLIMNLITFIEQMTLKNEKIANKICTALDYLERVKDNLQNQNNNNNPQLQQQPSAFGGFGGFGTATNTTTPPSPFGSNSNATPQIHSIDYAMYEYTLRQRQLASECLFYLTYHTQCNPNEVTSLIDIVKHLTNGNNVVDGGTTSGIGSGLPILDAIRDVPDPYTLSWNNDSSSTSSSSQSNSTMQGITMTTPQQRKLEKGRVEWENELSSSLMSVRGLVNATITSMHQDFSGHSAYHTTPLRSIASSDNDGNNDKTVVNVNGGKPQLLQCVTTLIFSIICSLDGKNTLMDRNNHGPNDFGIGNALFPPQFLLQNPTEIHDALAGIHERLDPRSSKYSQWKRQDISGLLSAAYALLLRPSTNIFTSPTKSPRERSSSGGSTSSLSTNAVYQTLQACLEAPPVTKALTFARVSLMSCIGLPSMKSSSTILDNDFTFYISVLSDFTSQYLDALSSSRDLPMSRAKWMELEVKELQMKHIQENQRRQLHALSGQRYQEVDIPTEVDLHQRPDCLDDVIALAVKICSVYPECAYRFWSTNEKIITHEDEEKEDEYVIELQPSKIVKKLENAQVKDSSLLPVYISFLGAISLYQSPHDDLFPLSGADAVHEWMTISQRNSTPSSSPYIDENKISWEYILNAIRWYTNQLNPPQDDNVHDSWRTSGSMHDQTDSDEATGYYYGAENSSNYSNNSNVRQQSSTSLSSSRSTQHLPKELDESSSQALLSLLSLLSYVAYKSEAARNFILNIKLPVPGSKRFVAVEDDALTILFSLVLTPISSELRGMAFSAVSNLLRCGSFETLSVNDQTKSEELMSRCWDLLELAQILPTRRLAQYSLISETPTSNPFFSSPFSKREVRLYFLTDRLFFHFN